MAKLRVDNRYTTILIMLSRVRKKLQSKTIKIRNASKHNTSQQQRVKYYELTLMKETRIGQRLRKQNSGMRQNKF